MVDDQGRLFWRMDRKAGLGTTRKRAGDRAGWLSCSGYWSVWMDGVNIQAHRVVWALTHGEWPPGLLDHADRDRTNNRPDNLRLATSSQNAGNTTKRKGPGIRGVSKAKGCDRWTAKICMNKKKVYLGIFKTPEEASSAYEQAASKHYGEFYAAP
jgi:hypothetical protein